MVSILIWLSAIVATGLSAGFVATAFGSILPHLSSRQRFWLPYVSASLTWLVAGAVAEYGFHQSPWGWPARWANNLLASSTWLSLAELISIWISRSFSAFAKP